MSPKLPNVRNRIHWLILPLCFTWFVCFVQQSQAQSPSPAAQEADSNALYLPLISGLPATQPIIITAAHIDSATTGEPDEAIMLWNLGAESQALAGWQIKSGTRTATFAITSTLHLDAGQRLWCTAQATAFRTTFPDEPSCEWAADSDPTVENLEGKLGLTNSGGFIKLFDNRGALKDVLLYGDESLPTTGWQGAAAQIYHRGDLTATGQVWQRKLDPQSWRPIDNDQASDWAGDLSDLVWGRRVRMPGWSGWNASDRGLPISATATASVTVLVGPEGLFVPLRDLLASAQSSIHLSIYTLEHPEATQALVDAAKRGVEVQVLLEGSPPGGISDLQKWCVSQLAAAGGDVRYLAARDDAPKGYPVRYRFTHAKYGIIDGRFVMVGTDNFNYDSMPTEQVNVVGGRRGFYLLTDAAPVVSALQSIFAADWRPERFLDLHPFDPAHAKYGGPPADFVLPAQPIYFVKESPFRQPVSFQGNANFAVISSPENSLRPDAGILALIARAGAGDEIHLMQLYEHKNWGDSTSSPIADPNPRLQALIEAARRGASVRLMLDKFFDNASELRSNAKTVEYINALAAAEGLDLQAKVANPSKGGIHAKIVLIRLGEEHWSAVGSLNGGEVSYKLNREVVLLTDLAGVYDRLTEVFTRDWGLTE
ncbi:MAG: phospholipase D-like domain-containing protein [Caldilineaceae bacterium]